MERSSGLQPLPTPFMRLQPCARSGRMIPYRVRYGTAHPLWGRTGGCGDGRSPGPAWPVRDGGRTVSSRLRRIGPTRSFPKGDTTCPLKEPPARAEPPTRRSMPDACGIVRSRYLARTGAGYVLVFSNKPGGLLGVLTALMGLMSRGLCIRQVGARDVTHVVLPNQDRDPGFREARRRAIWGRPPRRRPRGLTA